MGDPQKIVQPAMINVWKVASRWSETGYPESSIIDIFRKYNVVFVGTSQDRFRQISEGDLIAISDGLNVVAMGLALTLPLPVTRMGIDFTDEDKEEFDYNSKVWGCRVSYMDIDEPVPYRMGAFHAVDERADEFREIYLDHISRKKSSNENMNKQKKNNTVRVEIFRFDDLFDTTLHPLALDTYQRPYVWGKDKIGQMIEDLADFINSPEDSPDYYMGTLLLHHHNDKMKRFVIDGQQRLTTLLVLQAALSEGIPENQEFSYRSLESAGNIKAAQALIDEAKHKFKRNRLFERICFTVITVDSEDLAFTFFDTQNHRGVPLDATDLLKAYHLRAIRGSSDVALQTKCATMWERMQHYQQIIGNKVDFAPTLFNRFLWRARCWSGQKDLVQETYGSIIHEFQERPIPPPADNTVPLYPTHRNIHAASLVMNPDSNLGLIKQSTPDKQHLGELFAIRQPISQGLGFFLYTDQYAALLQKLMCEQTGDPSIRDFMLFFDRVVSSLSNYLRELYLLASLMYVDQFGTRYLLSFALWLDHVLGAIRLYKQYIFRQAPMIYLRDSSRNLLDVIAGAFTPEEVIEFLKADTWADSVYRDDTRKPIEPGVGVQGVYMKMVMDYYGKTESIKNKRKWIEEKLS